MNNRQIILKKVRVNNLKNIDLVLPHEQFIVFTGVSGSGKSSIAFDTLFVEGQRRYIESLSHYARRYIESEKKPEADLIFGLSPTIAIEQKSIQRSPRSTIGTMTGIYDYLRVLFAKSATLHCPISGEVVTAQSKETIFDRIFSWQQKKILLLSPIIKNKKGSFIEEFADLQKKGFLRFRVDGKFFDSENFPQLDPKIAHTIEIVIDRLVVDQSNHSRLRESIDLALDIGKGFFFAFDADTEEETSFSQHAYSEKSQTSYEPLEASDFSFNHPSGMCPACSGLGEVFSFDLNKIIDPEKGIAEDCCLIAPSYKTVRYGNIYNYLAKLYKFNIKTPWKDLSEDAKRSFLYGLGRKWVYMPFVHPITKVRWQQYVRFEGVITEAEDRLKESKSEFYRKNKQALQTQSICPDCLGKKIKPYPAAAVFYGKKIWEITSLTLDQCLNFFQNLQLKKNDLVIADDLVKEIQKKLQFLCDVGLSYLTLDRGSPTLSGGEAQRIKLAAQIGASLSGTTYILDEPSIGLHPSDHHKLLQSLFLLKEQKNTVIVVEHDRETILSADWVVEVGPGGGKFGGEILFSGKIHNLIEKKDSLTGAYLRGDKTIAIPKKRNFSSFLKVKNAYLHNLKNIDVQLPLGCFVCLTGVSGSGKSSLLCDTIYPYLAHHLHKTPIEKKACDSIEGIENIDKVVFVDQSPIGRSSRSNPVTYIQLFDDIRKLFASLPESKAKGFSSSFFSFNVLEGACPYCRGLGTTKLDMEFLEESTIECIQCKGKRFSEEILSITYKEKNIFDVLEMEVSNALEFFSSIPHIYKKLSLLEKVGLGYIHLGQPSTTLSGGEAQRIKLAKELSRPSTGKTFYILDEPTTGLHFDDINKLIFVLQELVDKGNSVYVIEHNMDLVKVADWVIDLGPKAGEFGGKVLFEGPPEKLSKQQTLTALALKTSFSSSLSIPSLSPSQLSSPPLSASSTPLSSSSFSSSLSFANSKDLDENLDEEKSSKEGSVENQIEKSKSDGTVEKEKPFLLEITNASQNNLKNISLKLPHFAMNIFCGPSGSGKSSLALETIYAEGQRRYTEALPLYTRQFIKQLPKPKVEKIIHLFPPIVLEQKHHAVNPRSTVGTLTEIYDFLRVIFAYLGEAYCPETQEKIQTISKEYVLSYLLSHLNDEKIAILAPFAIKEDLNQIKEKLLRQGFLRIRLNNSYYELDSDIPYEKKQKNELFLVIDRLQVNKKNASRILEAITMAAKIAKGSLVIAQEKEDFFFNLAFSVPKTGKSYPAITPHTFSFNSEQGMCPECQGIGSIYGLDLSKNDEFLQMNLKELFEFFFIFSQESVSLFNGYFSSLGFSLNKPIESFSEEEKEFFFNGSIPEETNRTTSASSGNSLTNRSETDRSKLFSPYKTKEGTFIWQGLNTLLAKAAKRSRYWIRKPLLNLVKEKRCPECFGLRLNALARNVRLKGLTIAEICSLPIEETLQFFQTFSLTKEQKFLDEILKQIQSHLTFLMDLGVGYLSLERSSPTLSGGEMQRIRLAKHLSSGLTSCIYVLDEPTIGLHPKNIDLLHKALQKLKDLGNTLILIEHDPLTLELADYLVDFGPGAGKKGGEILAQGSLQELKKNPKSLTGSYLSGKKTISLPQKRKKISKDLKLSIHNAALHNLKNITVDIPVGCMTAITGVSGSGKSSLIYDLLLPTCEKALKLHPIPSKLELEQEIEVKELEIGQIEQNINAQDENRGNIKTEKNKSLSGRKKTSENKSPEKQKTVFLGIDHFNQVLCLDQNPVGQTERADVSSYSDITPLLRSFFASLPQAKILGLQPKHFSNNHKKGMCQSCLGIGRKKVSLQFLPPVEILCENCHGYRLNAQSLELTYQKKHFGQILQLSIEEAITFFASFPRICKKLQMLKLVGLEYLSLDQEIATLSGGEAQRLKLAKELAKRSSGRTLYLFDEPTIGLHNEDIQKLLPIFHSLVEKENTVVIVEHNLDVIANCDHVIDLGPEGGKKGGYIVGTGTPFELAENKNSYTGLYLKQYFAKRTKLLK